MERVLYTFWEHVPKLRFVEVSKSVIESHPSRSAILEILREGTTDEVNGTKKTRHAMSVSEIRRALIERDIEVSKTGIYFHINTLEQAGLIQLITFQLEGRQKVAYYSRPARHLFVSETEAGLKKLDNWARQLESLAKVARLNESLHNLGDLAEKYRNTRRERERILGEWLVARKDIIDQQDLDMSDLFELLKMIDSVNPEYVGLLGGVFEALEL